MNMRGPKAGHFVRVAINEQAKRIRLRQILCVYTVSVGVVLERVDKWPKVKAACGIHEMQFRWRSKRQIAVLRGKIVRSKKSRKQQRYMQQNQKNQQRYWVKCSAHSYTARIRG